MMKMKYEIMDTLSKQLNEKLDPFFESVKFCSAKITDFEKQLKSLEEKVRTIAKTDILDGEVKAMKSELHALEQYSRGNNIEIQKHPRIKIRKCLLYNRKYWKGCGMSYNLYPSGRSTSCTETESLHTFASKLEVLTASIRRRRDDIVMVCGDMNLPNLTWYQSTSKHLNYNTPIERGCVDFVDSLSVSCLKQFNHVTNHNNRILDLILCNADNIHIEHSQNPI